MWQHVVRKAKKLWARLGVLLRQWGEHNNAAPGLILGLLLGLTQWRQGGDETPLGTLDVTRAFSSQAEI